MAKECFFPSYKFLHNFPEFLKQVLWRYIPDTPHVQYWYAESEHYILKFPNGTYGFVMARSPREAYDNFFKENSKEAIMAIELHHLHPGHDDELTRLKARIAELEVLNHDLCERVTENDEIRLHWEEIEQTRAENERMKVRIAELERMDAEHTVQIAKMPPDLEEDFEKAEFGSHIKDISFNLARKIERKMFEVMLESKSSKVFVVDLGPKYDGNIAKWDAEITCDEDKARHLAGNEGIYYREIDFENLIVMNDDEFENLLMEGLSRGDRNGDVVRKWRDFMKQQTKETK